MPGGQITTGLAPELAGDTKRESIGKIIAVAVQLLLLSVVIYAFRLQDEAFRALFLGVSIAFVIHACLPRRYRLLFFLLVSVASIVYLLGGRNGIWIIGAGLIIFGICHFPVQFRVKTGLILAFGVFLALLRADPYTNPTLRPVTGWFFHDGLFSPPWSVAIWPILGSMFMFRVILYLHEIRHERGRPQVVRGLSYFFMLPNVCFPLFPVVDYKRFCRNYYNEDSANIYQRGVSWVLRGIAHLVLYRFVYLYATIDPRTVDGVGSFIQFSLSAFLLYLQVSGQFHLIVGILLLFGFNLPETHHRYFLASSFTDFWRRINIYWKDFMMKIFYYPVHQKVRKFGEAQALVISSLAVFAATWFLHAYQWFWLRGSWLLEWHDALFWLILAVLVVINSLYESKYGRERALGKRSPSAIEVASTTFSTLGTFLTICLLWSMWSSDSLSQWISMLRTTGQAWIAIPLLIAGLFGLSIWTSHWARNRKKTARARRPLPLSPPNFWRQAQYSTLSILGVLSLGQTALHSRLPSNAGAVLSALASDDRLSEWDTARLEIGYYEDLISVGRHNSALWNLYNRQPEDWGEWPAGAQRLTGDLRDYVLSPNIDVAFKGARLTTNEWSMRDKSYSRSRRAGTTRMAVLGGSHVMGAGVENSETFEAVLEQRLNDGAEVEAVEILNFGYTGRTSLHQVTILEKMVLPFEPDIVLWVAHFKDSLRAARALANAVKAGVEIPYPYLRSVVNEAQITPEMSVEMMERELLPFADDLLRWAYESLSRICRENNIVPIWVFLPIPNERFQEADLEKELTLARETGFLMVNLRDVYEDHDPSTLVVAPWDMHPNALGHRLVANKLYDFLIEGQLFSRASRSARREGMKRLGSSR